VTTNAVFFAAATRGFIPVSRGRTIAFWLRTVLVLFDMFVGGLLDILRAPDFYGLVVVRLGYPEYFLILMGCAKTARRGSHAGATLPPAQGVGLRRRVLHLRRRSRITSRGRRPAGSMGERGRLWSDLSGVVGVTSTISPRSYAGYGRLTRGETIETRGRGGQYEDSATGSCERGHVMDLRAAR
jgi:hypothetical protein